MKENLINDPPIPQRYYIPGSKVKRIDLLIVEGFYKSRNQFTNEAIKEKLERQIVANEKKRSKTKN